MVSWAVTVVDVAGAEVDGASVDHGSHSVHLVTAEQRGLHAGLTLAEHVD